MSAKRRAAPPVEVDGAEVVASEAIAAIAGGGKGRWPDLLACGAVERVGMTHFVCRGNASCRAYTRAEANDSGSGSSNAFVHVLGCCPHVLSKDLLLEALQSYKDKFKGTVTKWAAEKPVTGGVGVLSFVRERTRALAAPASLITASMSWSQKLDALADVMARGIAASGLPLTAATGDFAGCIVDALMPGCPIPSHHMIGARIPGLYRKAARSMYDKLCLVWDSCAVPTDFSAALETDVWSASKSRHVQDGFATTSCKVIDGSGLLRSFELGVQHLDGKHDAGKLLEALDEIKEHPFLLETVSIHPESYGILTTDTGSAGKCAWLIYEQQQQMRLCGLRPDSGLPTLIAANAASRQLVKFWRPCACHVAELAVKSVLNKKTNMQYAVVAAAAECIDLAEGFADYFRSRNRAEALKKEVAKAARLQGEGGMPVDKQVVYSGATTTTPQINGYADTNPPTPPPLCAAIPKSGQTRWHSKCDVLKGVVKLWPAMRGVSPDVLSLQNAEAKLAFVQQQAKMAKVMEPQHFSRNDGTADVTYMAALLPSVIDILERVKIFIKINESREDGVIAKLPSYLDRLYDGLDTSIAPGNAYHDDAKPLAAQLRGELLRRFCDGRATRVLDGTVHAAQLFDASTSRDVLVSRPDHVAQASLLSPLQLRIAEQRLIAGRDTAEVLLKHFEYKVREKLAAASAAAGAAAVGAPPPQYFDEQREMSLAETEARRAAADAALDSVAAFGHAAGAGAAGVGAGAGAAGGTSCTARQFITTVLEPALASCAPGTSNAAFWAEVEVEHVRSRKEPGPNKVWWWAAMATHNMLAAGSSSSSEPERMNSILTALVSGSRNTLSPKRIVQLGFMRMVLRGKWARTPRWRKKRAALAAPAVPHLAAGGGAGGGAAGGAGGGIHPMFAPCSAAAGGPDGAFEEVEPDAADLLEVVLDAVVQEGDDDDLDVALDVTAAGPDAVVVDSDSESL